MTRLGYKKEKTLMVYYKWNGLAGDRIDLMYNINFLLYRQECSNGKYTTHKIQTKLHLGPEWHIFHTFTSEDIDDIISHFFTGVCANSQFTYLI